MSFLLVRLLRTGLAVQGACQSSQRGAGASWAHRPVVAPVWHTALLVALLLAVAVTGLLLAPSSLAAPSASRIVGSYWPLLVVNLALLAYVTRVGLGRSVLPELLGVGWGKRSRLVADFAHAALLSATILSLESALSSLVTLERASALLPTSGIERACWVLVAVVVGVSEELVYRGYLQRQLSAWTRSLPWGVVSQAALFGLAHGEQGALAMLRFAGYALLFGWVAERRRSLLPGMLGHVAIDVYAGLGG